jgi:hypothetical protein
MLDIDPEKGAPDHRSCPHVRRQRGVSDPDFGSNASDDMMVDVLEDLADDATGDELGECIRGLDEDEQVNLVALAWIGRGTYDASQWQEALAEALRVHNARTAEYLLSLPKLGDYLEEGLSAIEEKEDLEEPVGE